MPLVTKNGSEVFDIDDSQDSVDAALAKGYRIVDHNPSKQETAPKEASPSMSENIDSFRANFGKSAPFIGAADKVASAGEAAVQEIGDLFRDEKDRRSFGDRYQESVDFYNKDREEKADQGSTLAKIAGTGAGIAANLAVPSPGGKYTAAKGIIGAATRLAGNVGVAGADAALANPNKLLDADAAAKAMETAAKFGGAGEGASAFLQLMGKASNKLQTGADKLSWRAAIGRNEKLANEIGDRAAAGAKLREMGIVKAGDTAEDIRRKLVAMQRDAGKNRAAAMQAVDAKFRTEAMNNALKKLELNSIDELKPEQEAEFWSLVEGGRKAGHGAKVADTIRKDMGGRLPEFKTAPKVIEKPTGFLDQFGNPLTKSETVKKSLKVPGQESVRNSTEDVADFFDKLGNTSLDDLQRAKGTFRFKVNDQHTHAIPQDVQNSAKSAVGKIQQEAVQGGERKFPEELKGVSKKYNKANSDYGFLSSLQKGVKTNAARIDSNAILGLAGGVGAGTFIASGDYTPSGLAKAATAALITRGVKLRGASTGQAMLNRMAKITNGNSKFAEILKKAGSRGKAAYLATHASLLNDPEYLDLLAKESQDDTEGP